MIKNINFNIISLKNIPLIFNNIGLKVYYVGIFNVNYRGVVTWRFFKKLEVSTMLKILNDTEKI